MKNLIEYLYIITILRIFVLYMATLTHPLYQSPQREVNEYKYGTMVDNQCICCMKPMKEGEVLRVHMNTNWEAVHNTISDEDCGKLTGADSQGTWEIGNSCAKKMPKGFIIHLNKKL